MLNRRVKALVRRELLELKRNPLVWSSMLIVPLAFAAMTVWICYYAMHTPASQQKDLAKFVPPPELAAYGKQAAFAILMNDQFMFYFLMVPMLLPGIIASYSIAGEKQTRSLEPLLATPITTRELLIGKTLGAFLPSIAITIVSYLATGIGLVFAAGWPVGSHWFRPIWLIGAIVTSPLLALWITLLTVWLSSRVTEAKAVQGLSGLLVLPLVGFSLVVLFKRLYLGVSVMLYATAVLLVLNWLSLRAAEATFQRETILTRWKW